MGKLMINGIDYSSASSSSGGTVATLEDLGITATAEELNKLDGLITTAAELTRLSGLTASSAELNILDGATLSTEELNYLDGVTSAIQTQLNGKQATISGGASTIASSNLTASRALVSNSSGKVAVSAVTSTELGYLDGVTSAIQTQLNARGTKPVLSGNATKGSLRFPDTKVQIAWISATIHGAIATPYGTAFETSEALNFGNWQQAFNAVPRVGGYVAGQAGCFLIPHTAFTATYAGKCYLQRSSSLTDYKTYTATLVAVGTYS